jgi:GntR family transcriptional regulator/MocR family aminotransferase
VVSVYERLYADDLIETRQGDGTYIRYRGQEVDEGPDVPEIPALRVDSRLPLTARFSAILCTMARRRLSHRHARD